MSSAISSTDQLPSAAGDSALNRLRTWPGEHRVAVGLSGGVDSSLTAALLVEAGWEVEGLTLWLMSGKGAVRGVQVNLDKMNTFLGNVSPAAFN